MHDDVTQIERERDRAMMMHLYRRGGDWARSDYYRTEGYKQHRAPARPPWLRGCVEDATGGGPRAARARTLAGATGRHEVPLGLRRRRRRRTSVGRPVTTSTCGSLLGPTFANVVGEMYGRLLNKHHHV